MNEESHTPTDQPPLVLYLGSAEHVPLVRAGLGGEIRIVQIQPERDALLSYADEASAILDASMKLKLDAALLGQLPRLKVIVTATTGADHIDGHYLASRNIPLMTLAGQTDILRQVNPAAEHSWLLLLACARRLRPAIYHVDDAGWDRSLFPGVMLRGKTLGVLGCGRIGQWMARYANAFEMRVLGFEPYPKSNLSGIELCDLRTLLQQADFVSIHVPLNEQTRAMLGRDELSWMKSSAILINTSRGSIVDEEALVESMERGHIAACGFDVLSDEPEIQRSRLWEYAKRNQACVITPHIGGFSPEALAIVLRFSGERVRHFLQGVFS